MRSGLHPGVGVLRAAAVMATLGLASAPACTPAPKNVPCSNGGDCAAADPKYQFCLESRCVECVGNASCGDGNLCVDGRCQRHCRDGRDCPDGEACQAGRCGPG